MIDINDVHAVSSWEIDETCIFIAATGEVVLVANLGTGTRALFLTGKNKFRRYRLNQRDSMRGIAIKEFSVAIDPLSICDLSRHPSDLGCLRIGDGCVSIMSDSLEKDGFKKDFSFRLNTSFLIGVGFSRWSITVGKPVDGLCSYSLSFEI